MEYTLTRTIFVTFDFIGFHRWPSAPAEVSYLSQRHRHKFNVRVELQVDHDDRAIEYHMLKRDLRAMLPLESGHGEQELNTLSCEQISQTILDSLRFTHKYAGLPFYRVEVNEDDENGSIIEART